MVPSRQGSPSCVSTLNFRLFSGPRGGAVQQLLCSAASTARAPGSGTVGLLGSGVALAAELAGGGAGVSCTRVKMSCRRDLGCARAFFGLLPDEAAGRRGGSLRLRRRRPGRGTKSRLCLCGTPQVVGGKHREAGSREGGTLKVAPGLGSHWITIASNLVFFCRKILRKAKLSLL